MKNNFKRFLSTLLILSFIISPIVSVQNALAENISTLEEVDRAYGKSYAGNIREVNVTPGENASSEAVITFTT